MAQHARGRLDFRLSEDLHAKACRLAEGRSLVNLDGSPNLSQLMRVLIVDEHARVFGEDTSSRADAPSPPDPPPEFEEP